MMEESKCGPGNVTSVILINQHDIKEINEKDGIVLKRKYGKFDRKVFKHNIKK